MTENSELKTSSELLGEIFSEATGSLYNNLPCGYAKKGMGRTDEVDALLGINVVKEYSAYDDFDTLEEYKTWPELWPGPEIGVRKWWLLESGHKVGWQLGEKYEDWKFIVIDP